MKTILAMFLLCACSVDLKVDLNSTYAGSRASSPVAVIKQAITQHFAANNSGPITIGDDWLKTATQCAAAQYAPQQFTFTDSRPGQAYVLTSPSYKVGVGINYCQDDLLGGICVGQLTVLVNKPGEVWKTKAFPLTLGAQKKIVAGGHIYFNKAMPAGSTPSVTLSTCSIAQDATGLAYASLSNAF